MGLLPFGKESWYGYNHTTISLFKHFLIPLSCVSFDNYLQNLPIAFNKEKKTKGRIKIYYHSLTAPKVLNKSTHRDSSFTSRLPVAPMRLRERFAYSLWEAEIVIGGIINTSNVRRVSWRKGNPSKIPNPAIIPVDSIRTGDNLPQKQASD